MRIVRSSIICAVLLTTPLWAQEKPSPLQSGEAWESLQYDVFGTEDIVETPGALSLDTPFRAHDPALVPVRVTQPADGPRIEELTLVIDENPSPVAATFTLGPAMHPLDLEVRVRVNAYSNVRAVARTEGGQWQMAGRFVRATGAARRRRARMPRLRWPIWGGCASSPSPPTRAGATCGARPSS